MKKLILFLVLFCLVSCEKNKYCCKSVEMVNDSTIITHYDTIETIFILQDFHVCGEKGYQLTYSLMSSNNVILGGGIIRRTQGEQKIVYWTQLN